MPEMTRYSVVFLIEPPDAPELPPAAADDVQQRHLAYLTSMRERGAMATAGPFRDRVDESLRGMCLYVTGLEETRALAEADPAVRAGQLRVEVYSWVTPSGEL